MMPFGFFARISAAVVVEGTVITSRPRFKSSRLIFALAPKSHSTTRLPLPSFIATAGSFTFVPSERTGTARYNADSAKTTSAGSSIFTAEHVTLSTAFVILNALIFLSSAAFFEGEERAAKASAASLPSPEISIPFMTPTSRSTLVSARVSISYKPIMFWDFKKESIVPSFRKFEGTSHQERTM